MKRKVSSLPSRIWSFGVQAPSDNAELFNTQLLMAHRYYNALIEIERWRRAEYRKARSAVADLAPLEEQHTVLAGAIEELRTAIKARRSAARTRGDAPEKTRLRELAAERKAVYAELKAARIKLRDDPALKAASDKADEEAKAKVRAARAASGTYWGSYLLVEKAIEAARKSAVDPEFRRWKGEGRVGVQLHHELFSDVLEGKSTMLRLTLNEPRSTSRRAQKRRFGTLQLRAGSGEGRTPIWISFPVILHRLPPPGATLTWAWVRATRIGTSLRYELQLTVESEAFDKGPCGKGVCAIDIGWRLLPDGALRVGYLRDDKGIEREFYLPKLLLERLRFCSQLRSYQSLHFDTARAAWARWIATEESLPEWMAEVKQYIHQWKSPARMAKAVDRWIEEAGAREELDQLWELWRDARLASKLDLFDTLDVVADFFKTKSHLGPTLIYMELWRRKSRHLHDWEVHQRSKCLGWRKDIYRNIAAELAKTYKTVVVEDFDLRRFARNAQPEEATADHFHWIRNTAAPSELRGCLVSALGKDRVVKELSVDSTRECDFCHHVSTWTDKERCERVLECQGCHRQWDQDSNAARVLLRRYFERFGGGGKREDENTAKKPKAGRRGKDRSQTRPEVHGITAP